MAGALIGGLAYTPKHGALADQLAFEKVEELLRQEQAAKDAERLAEEKEEATRRLDAICAGTPSEADDLLAPRPKETAEERLAKSIAAGQAAVERQKRKAEKRERKAQQEVERKKEEAEAEAKRQRLKEKHDRKVAARLDAQMSRQSAELEASLAAARERALAAQVVREEARFTQMNQLSQGWAPDGGRAVRDAARAAERRRSSPPPSLSPQPAHGAAAAGLPRTGSVPPASDGKEGTPPPRPAKGEGTPPPRAPRPASPAPPSPAPSLGRETTGTPPPGTPTAVAAVAAAPAGGGPRRAAGAPTQQQGAAAGAGPCSGAPVPGAVAAAVCAVCGKEAKTGCARCKSVHYCARACQKKHWKKHKPTCKLRAASLLAGSDSDDY